MLFETVSGIVFSLVVYFGLAIFAFWFASWWFARGIWRPVARATVIALFFSITFVGGGHGPPAPIPACVAFFYAVDSYSQSWADPLWAFAIQWVLWVAIFVAWHLIKQDRRAREDPAIKNFRS